MDTAGLSTASAYLGIQNSSLLDEEKGGYQHYSAVEYSTLMWYRRIATMPRKSSAAMPTQPAIMVSEMKKVYVPGIAAPRVLAILQHRERRDVACHT